MTRECQHRSSVTKTAAYRIFFLGSTKRGSSTNFRRKLGYLSGWQWILAMVRPCSIGFTGVHDRRFRNSTKKGFGRLFHEAGKEKSECQWRSQDIEVAINRNVHWRQKLYASSGADPRDRPRAPELKMWGYPRLLEHKGCHEEFQILSIKVQDLVFVLLGINFSLIWSCLVMHFVQSHGEEGMILKDLALSWDP